jgi:hypothetical protein
MELGDNDEINKNVVLVNDKENSWTFKALTELASP